MKSRATVIITDTSVVSARFRRQRGQWRTCGVASAAVHSPITLEDETAVEPLVSAIREALAQLGASSDITNLVIPGGWCFICRLDVPHRRFSESSAAYLMEEYLPLPLEEVTYAFEHDSQGRVWCVAVQTSKTMELIAALEAAQVVVERIYVDIFTAIAAQRPSVDCEGVTILDANRIGLAIRTRGRELPDAIRAFHVLPDRDRLIELKEQIELTESVCGVSAEAWTHYDLQDQPGLWDSGHKSEESDSNATSSEITRSLTIDDLLQAAVSHSDQPDLRTGTLSSAGRTARVSRGASYCLALLSILLTLLLVNIHLRGNDYNKRLDTIRKQQADLFQEVFPEAKSTRSPVLRCASERKRLEALTGSGPDQSSMGNRTAVLTRQRTLADLRDLVASLPSNVRMLLQEFTIDNNQVALRGQTASHRDAERISESINRLPGLQCKPPRTSRLTNGGVEFSIRAQRTQNDQETDEAIASIK